MATLALINHELATRGVYDSFWSFVLSNDSGVIGTAAGVTLGISTAALAYFFVTGLMIPLLALCTTGPLALFNKKLGMKLNDIIWGDTMPAFQLGKVWHMLTLWVLVVIIIFIVLDGLRKLANKLYAKKAKANDPTMYTRG